MSKQEYITVQDGQSVYDLGARYYGASEGASIFITDNPGLCDFENDPAPGTLLSYDPSKIIDQDVVTLCIESEANPANAAGLGGFSSGFSIGFNI